MSCSIVRCACKREQLVDRDAEGSAGVTRVVDDVSKQTAFWLGAIGWKRLRDGRWQCPMCAIMPTA